MDIYPNDIQMLIYKNLHKSYLHDVHFQMSKLLYLRCLKICSFMKCKNPREIVWNTYKTKYKLNKEIHEGNILKLDVYITNDYVLLCDKLYGETSNEHIFEYDEYLWGLSPYDLEDDDYEEYDEYLNLRYKELYLDEDAVIIY
jgi:hypothetical protein